MAITYVSGTSMNPQSSNLSYTTPRLNVNYINTPPQVGDVIVAFTAKVIGDTTALADSGGNTYTKLVSNYAFSGSFYNCDLWYTVVTGTASSFYISATTNFGSGGGYTIAQAFRGVNNTTPIDSYAQYNTGTSGATSINAATITTAAANEMIVPFVHIENSPSTDPWSVGTGYSDLWYTWQSTLLGTGASENGIQSSAGTYTPTIGNNTGSGSAYVSFTVALKVAPPPVLNSNFLAFM